MIDQPNIIYTVLKMMGVLVVLSGGLYACLQLAKRFFHAGFIGKTDALIRVLNVRTIGIKKQIALVEVPGAVLVIGMAGDRMELLDKIVDADIRKRISADQISAGRGQQAVSD